MSSPVSVRRSRSPNCSRTCPKVYKQLKEITTRLEKHYRDIQDFEFTIQEGKLYMLQTRNGKRTVQAAIKIAVDMVKEKLITKEEALMRIEPPQLDQLLHPRIDPKAKFDVIAKGLAASPGAASGHVYFTAEDAVKHAAKTSDDSRPRGDQSRRYRRDERRASVF